jgi:hypothetical protein
MYVKTKIMKKILYTILFAMIFTMAVADQPIASIEIHDISANQNIVDEDFFKHELQQSVLEFIGDLGLDPDSCYVPFKDEL